MQCAGPGPACTRSRGYPVAAVQQLPRGYARMVRHVGIPCTAVPHGEARRHVVPPTVHGATVNGVRPALPPTPSLSLPSSPPSPPSLSPLHLLWRGWESSVAVWRRWAGYRGVGVGWWCVGCSGGGVSWVGVRRIVRIRLARRVCHSWPPSVIARMPWAEWCEEWMCTVGVGGGGVGWRCGGVRCGW